MARGRPPVVWAHPTSRRRSARRTFRQAFFWAASLKWEGKQSRARWGDIAMRASERGGLQGPLGVLLRAKAYATCTSARLGMCESSRITKLDSTSEPVFVNAPLGVCKFPGIAKLHSTLEPVFVNATET